MWVKYNKMRLLSVCLLVELLFKSITSSIPFIQNGFLQPFARSNLSTTVRVNSTCEQCLCDYILFNKSTDYLALNCFTNETCQFFQTFPSSYTIQASVGSQLYFLQGIFPNASICCMPNITELLVRLQTVTPQILNLTFQPAAFGYDTNVPNQAAVIGWSANSLYWFNPSNMSLIRSDSIWTSITLVLYNNAIFTATDGNPAINVYNNSITKDPLINITDFTLSKTRKVVFINNNQTMIASAQSNQSLAVFDINSPVNYTFKELIPFPFPTAHGLANVNDTFLYSSTWTNGHIAAYNYQNSTWTYQSFVNGTRNETGSHITVDECGRVWYVMVNFGLRIYDPSGVEIGSWNMSVGSSKKMYDILLLPNYVLLVTRVNDQQIVRYDPQVSCL